MNAQIHKFEMAGLGQYPFRVVGFFEAVLPTGQPSGTCDYCGNGIKNCFRIQSADKKLFIVGCDCVKATGDQGLRKAINILKRQARHEANLAAREVKLNAERERNGGLTDHEVADNVRKIAEAAEAQTMTTANAWLIDALNLVSYESGFVDSMKRELTLTLAKDLSERCQQILSEIYAKETTGARKNSKPYLAAITEFEANLSR